MTKFIHIVAVSTNGVIGNGDDLPWRIPSDLQHFKEVTMNHYCIVGRKTYETIKHLKNRNFIVISRQSFEDQENAKYVKDVESAIEYARSIRMNRCYIIGGAEIYKQTFKYATKLLVTYVEKTVEGTAFYEIPSQYKMVKSSDFKSENGYLFYFMEYEYEKTHLDELIEMQREYDKMNPNSRLSFSKNDTREDMSRKLKEFFDEKSPD